MIGRKLSHYEIVAEISRGGMGVVYRAVDVNLGREVAIKVLPQELASDPERRARLLHEARAASALEHPNIAVIHEVGETAGVTFIAMELIRGEKLSDALRHGPLSPSRALTLAEETAEGLARAHDKGIVHRDLKPANVMVTDDGHAKVIDFGLAKLVERIDQNDATASVAGPRTGTGLVLGTAAYMSPEQARGARVDHRSDVFAVGVTLYEMLTGRPAFQGQSSLDTMQAVLTRAVPPLPAFPAAPAEMIAELQRIIGKCTAKEPDERYQGMRDVVVDLRAARRKLESAPLPIVQGTAAPERRSAPVRTAIDVRLLVPAVLAVAMAAAVVWWWTSRESQPPVRSSGKPAVAVLHFENNTGDASLDWMRTGLTDMLVTDLSQSPDIEVLGTDRLTEILQELRRADDRVVSADLVREIASRANVDNVLVGSYVKAGGTIRISARLQEARTGRIVTAERVEGAGESSVFQLVDELTRRFKSRMTPASPAGAASLLSRPGARSEEGLDRGVTEITTSSIDAYRYYAEGLSYHERGLPAQAIPLFEQAVEVDPQFAMALAKLAVVYGNSGRFDKQHEYARRAAGLVERLTPRERYYIQGFHYGLRPETRARSLESYRQGLALHPEHQASRHNLGLHYFTLERFPEGIEQYEELLRRGTSNPTTYENLATMLIQTGEVARGRRVADELLQRQPDSAAGHRTLGAVLIAEGRLEEARAAFERSEALDPLDFVARVGRRNVALLQERWADAESAARDLARSAAPFQQFLSLVSRVQIASARGRGSEALDLWDRAARLPGLAAQQRAVARNRQTAVLLRVGQTAVAHTRAGVGAPEARGLDQEFEALQWLAVAQAAAGRDPEAARTLETLERLAKILPSEREMRRIHWARGEIALRRGDASTAADELTRAQAMLPPRGEPVGPGSGHAALWFAAASANAKAGREDAAIRLFERLQAGHERVFDLDGYARSFYLLGQIYERRGDAAKARQQYAKFVDLWRDGDLERGWVAEAQQRLAR